MNTSSVQTGTTIQVLQAYPLGTLQVQYWTDAYGGTYLRDKVVGLRADPERVMLDEGPDMKPSQLTPILRPFRSLVTPIEGAKLAIELAKVALSHMHESMRLRWAEASVRSRQVKPENMLVVTVTVPGFHENHEVDFWQDWTIGGETITPELWKVYDKMRELQLAFGLPEGSYIPKE
jgi:NAD(P)-dependent dehydrogenase (short-subunit alcohol dehydrogenase family)